MPKVITIKQPFASLIMGGIKGYETRSRNTKHRGYLLIHSSKSKDMVKQMKLKESSFEYGKILGCVDLIETFRTEDLKVGQKELGFGDFTPGRWAWQFECPHKFKETIPARGNLGFWNWEFKV